LKYTEIEVDNGFEPTKTKHILVDKGNGEFSSFPADVNNPNYQEYLEWVNAGNTPEETV
jgi:hypothetical protein